MAKKKNKEKDFQKKKLKVGRRLLGPQNDTKTEFKSKKIIIKEMESRTKDPIKTLTNSYGINSQIKIMCLSSLNNWINSTNINTKCGEVVNVVCKYMNDCDQRVRNECIKCLKHCISLLNTKTNGEKQSISPLMPIILTYINCGLTHIDSHISGDALKLLSYLMDFCDNSLFNQLMQTIKSKISNKSNLDPNVLEICYKLVSLMNKNDRNSTLMVHKEPLVIKWSTDNYHCDLRSFTVSHKLPPIEIDLSFQSSTSHDISDSFLSLLKDIIKNEIKGLLPRSDTNLTLSISDARKAIYCMKMFSLMDFTIDLNEELPTFNITAINVNKKSNQKQQQLINHLTIELNASINQFYNKRKSK
ncbi:uncharacterized protein LOC128958381 [Oppia nitens]|uniref:uncharacterized protein LOC128958381 n=1 Tax=Oppia nitens TaxID=1686743 RepID=UPI0023DB73C3|nr:uncharacterized protein LOC128958381 [Oppia nitens]